jgi:CelD/BcsL family acetyltransferase involved in cellulose biosynthesis
VPARLVRATQVSELDAGRWRELAGRALEPNPYYEADFVVPWARHTPQWADLEVLLLERGGTLVGAVPVRAEPRWRRLPVRVLRSLPMALDTPLVDRGEAEAAVEELAFELVDLARWRRARLVVFESVVEGSALARRLGACLASVGLAPRRWHSWERPVLFCHDPAPPPGRERSNLQRKARRLAEALGGRLEVVDRAGSPKAVGTLLRLEASGWKGRAGTAMACRSQDARLFEEVCRRFAAQGRLQLLCLEAGGHTLAVDCRLRSGEGLFAFKTAFDESWARLSPGNVLHLMAIDHLEATGASWVDSCASPEFSEVLGRLWPSRRRLSTWVVPVDAGLPRLLAAGAVAGRRAYGSLRRSPAARHNGGERHLPFTLTSAARRLGFGPV